MGGRDEAGTAACGIPRLWFLDPLGQHLKRMGSLSDEEEIMHQLNRQNGLNHSLGSLGSESLADQHGDMPQLRV